MRLRAGGNFLRGYLLSMLAYRPSKSAGRRAIPGATDGRPQPRALVALMCVIGPTVTDAMMKAGVAQIPLYLTPFPSRPETSRAFQDTFGC